jgi:hypothetical protein
MLRKLQEGSLVFAAYALAGLSVLICGYFGTIMAEGLEGLLYATVLACLDVVKFNLPDIAETLLKKRRFGWVCVAVAGILPLSIMSITCELGVYSATVSHTTGPKLAQQLVYSSGLKDQLDLEKQISDISADTLVDARAKADKLRQNKLYKQTANCTGATLPDSIMFCQELIEADAGVERARQVESLRFQLAAVKVRNNAVDPQIVVTSATPQADTIVAVAAIMGLSLDKGMVPNILALTIACLMELVVVIFWLMRNSREEPETDLSCREDQKTETSRYHEENHTIQTSPRSVEIQITNASHQKVDNQKRETSQPLEKNHKLKAITDETDPIKKWANSRLESHEDKAILASVLLEQFNEWATESGYQRVNSTALGRRLGELGFKKDKIEGKINYLGIALRDQKPRLIARQY